MEERMPWSARTATAALLFVGLTWLIGFGLAAAGSPLGGLMIALATWLTAGLIYTAWRAPRRSPS